MIEIYNNGTHEKSVVSIDGYSIGKDYLMIAALGGTATHTTVASGGVLSATGGNVTDTAVNPGGTMSCTASGADGIRVLGGTLEITNQGAAKNVDVLVGGQVSISNGGSLDTGIVYWGDVSVDNGAVNNLSFQTGTLTLNNGATADRTHLIYDGSSIEVGNGALARNSRVDGTVIAVKAGGTAENTALNDISLYFPSTKETVTYHATMTLKSGAVHQGTLTIDSGSSVLAESGSIIDFTLTSATADSAALINDFSRISGTPDFTMTVSAEQAAGSYALAGNATGFTAQITLQCGEFAEKALSIGGSAVYHNSIYALALADGVLSTMVSDFATSGSAEALSWADINDAEYYALEMAKDGGSALALEFSTRSLELLGLANGNYTWQVRNSAESDNWQAGQAFSQTAAATVPQELVATGMDATALFFARTDGMWGSGYAARNMLTGDTVQLEGKIKITDIFTGSDNASIDNASILMLDAFGENTVAETRSVELAMPGMALFLDDIYSAAPGSAERARLSNIDTIIASDGDDIIDLTSDRYALAGNVTILGGVGDDILWANAGNDVLSGGSGNDILHGGGGNDTFCFGEGWGNDTIGQLAGAEDKVTLWFSQSSDILNLAFTTEGSDTLITAATGDTIRALDLSVTIDDCRFGATGYETEYNPLAAAGVFA